MGKIDFYTKQLERYERLIEEAMRFGEDDYPEGTVIKFRKQFVEGGEKYRYAAIKANGLWYTTGPKSPKGYTWDELVAWLSQGVQVKKIWLMGKCGQVTQDGPKVPGVLDGAYYAKRDVEATTAWHKTLDKLQVGNGQDDYEPQLDDDLSAAAMYGEEHNG